MINKIKAINISKDISKFMSNKIFAAEKKNNTIPRRLIEDYYILSFTRVKICY